jgi:hypothetical protein
MARMLRSYGVDATGTKRTMSIQIGATETTGARTVIISYGNRQEFIDQCKLFGVQGLTNERFPSASEEIVNSLAQAESDIIEAEITLEGNPEFYAGATARCIGLSGIPSSKYKAYRFDGNYRINEVTHEWSIRGYYCTIKASARAIQGVTAIDGSENLTESEIVQRQHSDKPASWNDFTGLWKKYFLLEPSLIWTSEKHIQELAPVLSTSMSAEDVQAEVKALQKQCPKINDIDDPVEMEKIETLGLHTYYDDIDRFLAIAQKVCRPLTFTEAANLLYGHPLPKE